MALLLLVHTKKPNSFWTGRSGLILPRPRGLGIQCNYKNPPIFGSQSRHGNHVQSVPDGSRKPSELTTELWSESSSLNPFTLTPSHLVCRLWFSRRHCNISGGVSIDIALVTSNSIDENVLKSQERDHHVGNES